MIGKQDRMTTITVKEPNVNEEAVSEKVTKMLLEVGHIGEYEHISIEHSQTETVYNTIKEFLKTQSTGTKDYIDFVACGNYGRGYDANKQKLGSLANALLRARRLNVIFVPHTH